MFALLLDNLCRRFNERFDARIDGQFLSAFHQTWQRADPLHPRRPGALNLRVYRNYSRLTVLARKSA